MRRSREHEPLALALLVSLLLHIALLSLKFGVDDFGLPRFDLPWRERRITVFDLQVVLVPRQATRVESAEVTRTEPAEEAPIDRPPAPRSIATGPRAPALESTAPAATSARVIEQTSRDDAPPSAAVATDPEPSPVAQEPVHVEAMGRPAPVPIPEPAAMELERSDAPSSWAVRADRLAAAPVIAAATSAPGAKTAVSSSPDSGVSTQEAQPEEDARREAARDAARQEAARQDAARQLAAEQEAQRLEAQRQEVARQEAASVELARLRADREETARRAAAQLETERQERARAAAQLEADRQETARAAATRLEAKQQETAREEAARLEAARSAAEREDAARRAAAELEAQRQETARLEAARAPPARADAVPSSSIAREAPRAEPEPDDEGRREARLRAIGRQLDEEAARRDEASKAAAAASTLPYSLSTARRARLWGRAHANAELVEYAEAFARKIQLNTLAETVREVAKRPHTPSMVIVALRSDGSVESVKFDVSSGVAEVDEAIRRIIDRHRPYPAFPRALAREFDVVEIRRTWSFDPAVRLQ